FFLLFSSTPRRTCCEVRVMLCMTQYICAPLQSAGGFILEGDWTPTKTYLSQFTTYRGGSHIFFQDKKAISPEGNRLYFGTVLFNL
ncbi:MAG: hypothetical protein PUG45_05205, partial [bacterium]|nr:hypothetical protein [bacterium]